MPFSTAPESSVRVDVVVWNWFWSSREDRREEKALRQGAEEGEAGDEGEEWVKLFEAKEMRAK